MCFLILLGFKGEDIWYIVLLYLWGDFCYNNYFFIIVINVSFRFIFGIVISSFFKMFKDVVFVIRVFGIWYLWIDFFCIV